MAKAEGKGMDGAEGKQGEDKPEEQEGQTPVSRGTHPN